MVLDQILADTAKIEMLKTRCVSFGYSKFLYPNEKTSFLEFLFLLSLPTFDPVPIDHLKHVFAAGVADRTNKIPAGLIYIQPEVD